MGEKFTLIENNTLFEFEYDENRFIYLLNYELKDSSKFRELKGIIKVTSTNRPSTVKTDLLVDKVYKGCQLETATRKV